MKKGNQKLTPPVVSIDLAPKNKNISLPWVPSLQTLREPHKERSLGRGRRLQPVQISGYLPSIQGPFKSGRAERQIHALKEELCESREGENAPVVERHGERILDGARGNDGVTFLECVVMRAGNPIETKGSGERSEQKEGGEEGAEEHDKGVRA